MYLTTKDLWLNDSWLMTMDITDLIDGLKKVWNMGFVNKPKTEIPEFQK